MAVAAPSAEQIQREMREVRADLRGNVQEMVEQASGLTDWQEYVKAYPWLSLGAAAVVGYLLVPSRPTVIQPSASELLELAKSHHFPLQVEQTPARPGFIGTLAGLAGNALLQTGMGVFTQYLTQMQQNLITPPSQDPRWREP
jgi:hypothetical protein